MDKNIQMGTLLVMFITIIVGVVLFIATAQLLGTSTQTVVYNTTAGLGDGITFPADTIVLDLTGQEIIGTPVISLANATGTIIPATNYTIDEGISVTTSVKTIRITGIGAHYAGDAVNISYTYGPDGYIESSGARAVAGLILIFTALAVAMAALEPTLRNGFMDMIGR